TLRTYGYDTNSIDSSYSQNAQGRLTTITYAPVNYEVVLGWPEGSAAVSRMIRPSYFRGNICVNAAAALARMAGSSPAAAARKCSTAAVLSLEARMRAALRCATAKSGRSRRAAR